MLTHRVALTSSLHPCKKPEEPNLPSKSTLKIQHKRVQQEIEEAIKSSNETALQEIDFEEFKQALGLLNYLPSLEKLRQPKYSANKFL
mmetsp:Transcript_30606/g.46968  ORF Transcript_30606/g.46968 Transcript_30606/m.46968 type:complete len:88 (-) Transcript_30606:383-646(-)